MTSRLESRITSLERSVEAIASEPFGSDECAPAFQNLTLSEECSEADEWDDLGLPRRSPADIAAEFANNFLMHRHRGVIDCDSYFVIYGNDGWVINEATRKEMADVSEKLREHQPQVGFSGDKMTWALVLTDHSRSLFSQQRLTRLLWDSWRKAFDEIVQKEV